MIRTTTGQINLAHVNAIQVEDIVKPDTHAAPNTDGGGSILPVQRTTPKIDPANMVLYVGGGLILLTGLVLLLRRKK